MIYEPKTGQIERFVEKPQEFVSNKINAGLYIFSTKILDRIPVSCISINIYNLFLTKKNTYAYWICIMYPLEFTNNVHKLPQILIKNRPCIIHFPLTINTGLESKHCFSTIRRPMFTVQPSLLLS